jgi:hypothetical protein
MILRDMVILWAGNAEGFSCATFQRIPEDPKTEIGKTKRRPGWSSSFCPPRKGSVASHER